MPETTYYVWTTAKKGTNVVGSSRTSGYWAKDYANIILCELWNDATGRFGDAGELLKEFSKLLENSF